MEDNKITFVETTTVLRNWVDEEMGSREERRSEIPQSGVDPGKKTQGFNASAMKSKETCCNKAVRDRTLKVSISVTKINGLRRNYILGL